MLFNKLISLINHYTTFYKHLMKKKYNQIIHTSKDNLKVRVHLNIVEIYF